MNAIDIFRLLANISVHTHNLDSVMATEGKDCFGWEFLVSDLDSLEALT